MVLFRFIAASAFCALTVSGQPSGTTFADTARAAAAARDSNDLDKAAGLYREAVALHPGWAEGWWYLGTILYERDSYANAADAFAKAAALDPKVGNAPVMLGLCEYKLGRPDDALRHIQQGQALGISSDPRFRHVMVYHQGLILLEKGRYEEAQSALDALARDGVTDPDATRALGMSVLGVIPAALEPPDGKLRAAIQQAGLAEASAARRETKQALEQYGRLAADYGGLHNVQFAYGRFLLASHYDDDAVAAFRREIENTPNHLLARIGIAGIKVRLDPAGGLPYAEQALALKPDLAEAHYLVGVLALETGDVRRAISELETAERSMRSDGRVYFALARAYARANRSGDAARARAAFAKLTPGASHR